MDRGGQSGPEKRVDAPEAAVDDPHLHAVPGQARGLPRARPLEVNRRTSVRTGRHAPDRANRQHLRQPGEGREPVRRHVRLDAAPVEVHDASAVRHERAGDLRCRGRGQLDRDRDRGTGHSIVDDEPRHELPALRRREVRGGEPPQRFPQDLVRGRMGRRDGHAAGGAADRHDPERGAARGAGSAEGHGREQHGNRQVAGRPAVRGHRGQGRSPRPTASAPTRRDYPAGLPVDAPSWRRETAGTMFWLDRKTLSGS